MIRRVAAVVFFVSLFAFHHVTPGHVWEYRSPHGATVPMAGPHEGGELRLHGF